MLESSRKPLGDLSVADFATINLKETFAELFCAWRRAVERPNEDPEQVHQVRVCSRRARAALELFREALPTRKTERLLTKLDNIRKSAGPARDDDVFLEKLRKCQLDGDVKRVITEYLQRQRSDSQEALRNYFEKCARGEQLERQAIDSLTSLKPRSRHSKELNDRLNIWVRRQLRSTSREFVSDADVDTKHLECLHQFRIRAKQFRYCLELLQPVLDADRFQRAYADLKKLSQRLGDINDHATAVVTLSNLLQADFSKKVHRALRRWRKAERRSLRHSVADFKGWWTSRRQRRMRRRLKNLTRRGRKVSMSE